jgi:hypothetical protein
MKILLDVLVTAGAGVFGLFVGWVIPVLPCLAISEGMYCSAHGGYGMLLGALLGLVLAFVVARKVWLKLRSSQERTNA